MLHYFELIYVASPPARHSLRYWLGGMDCQYHRHTAANGQCHISYVECHFTGNVFLDITHIRYFGYVMSAKNVFTLTIMYMSIPWNRAPLDTRNLAIRRLEAQKIVLLWGCICSIMELRVGMNCFTTGQCKSEKRIECYVNALPICWRSFALRAHSLYKCIVYRLTGLCLPRPWLYRWHRWVLSVEP